MLVSDRPYEWVVFDQGGTLFEPLPGHYTERNQRLALLELGQARLAGSPEAGPAFRAARKDTDQRFCKRAAYRHQDLVTDHLIGGLIRLGLCDASALDPEHRPDLIAQTAERYFARQCHDVVSQLRLKPGVHELFARLASRYRLAVVSNNADSYLQPLVRRYRLDRWLEASLSSDALGACKPHPDIFERAFEVLEIPSDAASRVLYVGDSRAFDVAGATAAGLDVAWLTKATLPRTPSSPKPTVTLSELSELGYFLGV